MEIRIVAGRPFEERERGSGPSPLILSETLARRLFGNEDPVGQQLDLDGEGHWRPVVGVAADTRNNGLTETLDPAGLARWMRTENGGGRSQASG